MNCGIVLSEALTVISGVFTIVLGCVLTSAYKAALIKSFFVEKVSLNTISKTPDAPHFYRLCAEASAGCG